MSQRRPPILSPETQWWMLAPTPTRQWCAAPCFADSVRVRPEASWLLSSPKVSDSAQVRLPRCVGLFGSVMICVLVSPFGGCPVWSGVVHHRGRMSSRRQPLWCHNSLHLLAHRWQIGGSHPSAPPSTVPTSAG